MQTPSTGRSKLVAAIAALLLVGSVAVAGPAGASVPSVVVTSSVNPAVVGQRIVLKATVFDPSLPAAAITGTAAFSDGPVLLGTVAVVNAKASLPTKALRAGSHSITASFTPTAGGPAIDSAVLVETVNPSDTTITLATSRPIANYGNAGNITATIKAVAPGAGVATGTVDFAVDGGYFITEPVGATGRAVLPLAELFPSLYPGTYTITATYSGDADYNPSNTVTSIAQTIVGLSATPISTITLNASGLPVFNPRTFTLSSVSPIGCNVTITNNTPTTQLLAYGTPGSWKRLPFGSIPPGASRGVGVGIGNFTGYFTTVANTANYVTLNCR